MDKLQFDRTDYSVVVKNRAAPPGAWKWQIYRAGRSSPVKQSSVYFHTMVTANRAGKEALKKLHHPSAEAKNLAASAGFSFPCHSLMAALRGQHQPTLFNFSTFAHANRLCPCQST